MTLFIVGAFSFIAGGVFVFLWRNARIAELNAMLSSERANKEGLLGEIRQKMSDAVEGFRQIRTESDTHLEVKKSEINSSVAGMSSKLEATIHGLQEDKGRVQGAIQQFLDLGQQLRTDIHTIQKVFSFSSGVRGALGEMLLQRILEDNGMVQGIHYDTQVTVSGAEQNDGRPDFVIRLPHDRRLIIDSKDVTAEYFLAANSNDEAQQKAHFQKLVQNIRGNVQRLSRKEYQASLDPEIPFVIMYIANEAAIRSALTTDPELFQEAYTKYKVFLASPMTIIPLIQLIRYSWRQKELADNAREIYVVVEQLGDRLATFVSHLHAVGGGIKKAAQSWDSAIDSWKKRVSPQVDKIKTMGGKMKDFEEPEILESDFSQHTLPKNQDLIR